MNKKLNDATKHLRNQGQSQDFGGRVIKNARFVNCVFEGSEIKDATLVGCKITGDTPLPTMIATENIADMTDTQLDALRPGDVVVKQTGTMSHTYVVTYKDAENGGICLSYNAAGYGETVSYDHTKDGWVYNSTDIKTYGD